MAQQQIALENKENTDNIFVTAEHFFEDFAKNTELIAKRAFERFQERGFRLGHELEDWFKAERELLKRIPIEIRELDGKLDIRAEVPGFTADNLKVSVEPERLIIKGEIESKSDKKKDETLYTEWKSNKIFRTIALPHRVEANKAVATVKDGVLHLLIPEIIDAPPKEIEVKPA